MTAADHSLSICIRPARRLRAQAKHSVGTALFVGVKRTIPTQLIPSRSSSTESATPGDPSFVRRISPIEGRKLRSLTNKASDMNLSLGVCKKPVGLMFETRMKALPEG